MISLRFDQLVTITGGQLRTAEHRHRTFTGVSQDSRTVETGQLFFAIRGDRNDGHQFIDQAVSRGAAGIVSQTGFFVERPLPPHTAVLEVPDTHTAMLHLAGEYLLSLKAKRLGITGSNGKTTTKEFAFRLLSARDRDIYRSPGNFNNLFGIPLALFSMPTSTRLAVLEMGISTPGEMARLAALVRPHLLAVTNVGPTHLEFLGTVEAVAREKLQAMKYAEPDAALIVNADDPVLMAEARRVHDRPITFAVAAEADYRPDSIRPVDGATAVLIESHTFRLPLFGQYQVQNLLAAYAIARTVGCRFDDFDTESIELSTASMRGETIRAGEITFISDCYNANPESVKAGLASLAQVPSVGRKVVILGDMLELGEASPAYHREIGLALGACRFDLVIAVGPLSTNLRDGAGEAGVAAESLHHFSHARACAEAIKDLLQPGDLVYLKGSRGIGLETVLKQFPQEEGRS